VTDDYLHGRRLVRDWAEPGHGDCCLGLGCIVVGHDPQGYDLQLTRYGD
jgi:hypothetical protein